MVRQDASGYVHEKHVPSPSGERKGPQDRYQPCCLPQQQTAHTKPGYLLDTAVTRSEISMLIHGGNADSLQN